MSENNVVATIRVYYNPVSKVYSVRLWEGNELKEFVYGDINAIQDWLFCLSLALPDVVEVL